MANNLSREKQVEIIAALVEGCSIRSVERLTGIHRDTIMRLGVRVGEGLARVHDATMRGVSVGRIELDEIWSFVGKKRAAIKLGDKVDVLGDQYTFIALAGSAKAILSYRTGKRTAAMTREFVQDLRDRVTGAPEISADSFRCYPEAVELAFGADVHFGTIDKHVAAGGGVKEAARRYGPLPVVAVTKNTVIGEPKQISTSYVERQNLSLRMSQRRFTRLTNGFSKKYENHCAAVALYAAHYNLCRVHEALRVTPAMQLGVADHVWTIGELVAAALDGALPETQGRRVGGFRVIDGGAG